MVTLICLLLTSIAVKPTFANTINVNTRLSTAGYFQLSWQADNAKSYTVQQALKASFDDAKTIYQGSDLATVISGLPNGHYFYRMQAQKGQWSNVVAVTVKHHTLQKAFAFFIAGAMMLLILIVVLIKGYKHAGD